MSHLVLIRMDNVDSRICITRIDGV